VNPTNASFTKDQVKFFDSEGKNLDEVIEIGDPKRYEGLITRGANVENGLWIIPVKVKEGVNQEAYNKATSVEVGQATKQILYAVAINNATDPAAAADAAPRYVASTYDLATQYKDFVPATDLDVLIGADDDIDEGDEESHINFYHNRWQKWNGSQTSPRPSATIEVTNKGFIHSCDQNEAYTNKNPEQAWKGGTKPAAIASDGETVDAENDFRFEKPFYTIEEVGEKIYLELPEELKHKIEYWYIAYDFQLNAVESAPSEWEAWQSYRNQIDGIYKTVGGLEQIELSINAETARGDVIGFRVFAVNFDGSLVDPDGKAFYVKVGDLKEIKNTAAGEFLAKQKSGDEEVNVGIVPVNFEEDFEGLPLKSEFYGKHWSYVPAGDNVRGGVTVWWTLCSDANGTAATNWNEIKFVKIGVRGEDLKKIVDGSTINVVTISDLKTDSHDKVRFTLNITAKKNMPTETKDGIVWKDGYDKAPIVYVKPQVSAFEASNTNGFLWNGNNFIPRLDEYTASYTSDNVKWAGRSIEDYVYSGLLCEANADYRHQFVFHNLPTGLNNPKNADFTADSAFVKEAGRVYFGSNYTVDVLPKAIDGDYTYDLNYVYNGISLKKDAAGFMTNEARGDFDYPVKVWSAPTTFKSALELYSFTHNLGTLQVRWADVENGGTAILQSGNYIVTTYPNLLADFNYSRTWGWSESTPTWWRVAVNTQIPGASILANDADLVIGNGSFRPKQWFDKGNEPIDIKIEGAAMTYLESTVAAEDSGSGATMIHKYDLSFTKKGGAASPTENKAGVITITGTDCFGKTHTWTVNFNLIP
jgi:hypothetical protein